MCIIIYSSIYLFINVLNYGFCPLQKMSTLIFGLDLAVVNDFKLSVVKALIQPRTDIDEVDRVS